MYLSNADGEFSEQEKKIVETLAKILNIKGNEIEQAFSIIYNLKRTYEELVNFISK